LRSRWLVRSNSNKSRSKTFLMTIRLMIATTIASGRLRLPLLSPNKLRKLRTAIMNGSGGKPKSSSLKPKYQKLR